MDADDFNKNVAEIPPVINNNHSNISSEITISGLSSLAIRDENTPQSITQHFTTNADGAESLRFKDQVRDASNNIIEGSDCITNVEDSCMGECTVVSCFNHDRSVTDEASVVGSSVHHPTIIPLAEAFVLEEDSNDNSSSQTNLHIVQIEEGTALANFRLTFSTRTQQTDVSSTENNDNIQRDDELSPKKLKGLAEAAVRRERKFWIKFVTIAIVLNSILVAGVVVGGFCGSGACSTSEGTKDDSYTAVPGPISIPTNDDPSLKDIPENDEDPDEKKTFVPSESVKINNESNDTEITVPTAPPSQMRSLYTIHPVNSDADDTFTTSSENGTSGTTLFTNEIKNRSSMWRSFDPRIIWVASALELVIVTCLIFYYRSWKQSTICLQILE